MKKTFFAVAVCMISTLMGSVALADFSCDGGWVSTDDPTTVFTQKKVKSLCGSPSKKKEWTREILIKHEGYDVKEVTHFSLWTYNRGSRDLIHYLLFREGVLIEIKEGDYGTD